MPRLVAIVFGLLIWFGISNVHAAPRTISVSEIKPGMKGYGLTVFYGTRPEKFDVEVVSIVPNYFLRQSIILIRCSHPVTDKAGVIGGMSGSPIFFEGRLAGALAYGWRFNKEPLAGVTPIKNMHDLLKRKKWHPRQTPFHRLSNVLNPFDKFARHVPPVKDAFFAKFGNTQVEQLVPAKTPLSLSGFSSTAKNMISKVLSPFGIEPVQGGGQGHSLDDPGKLVPGGAIGVQMIRGDMSAAGIGTVTDVVKNKVLAFGHPMFNMGQSKLPVTTAQIHTVIASVARSNKIGSPLTEMGAMVQDRRAAIMAETDVSATMIPATFSLFDSSTGRREKFKMEIVSHRLLTARLVHSALVNVIEYSASDLADVTAQIDGTIKIAGKAPLLLQDSGVSRMGIAAIAGYSRPAGVIGTILNNPFETAAIESVHFDITLKYGLDFSTIESVYFTAAHPAPGETVNLHVRLLSYGGKQRVVTVPVKMPNVEPGKTVSISVAGGDL